MRNIVTTYCSFSLLGTTDGRIKKIEGGLSGPYEARTPAAWTQGLRARAQHPCRSRAESGWWSDVVLCPHSHSHSQHCWSPLYASQAANRSISWFSLSLTLNACPWTLFHTREPRHRAKWQAHTCPGHGVLLWCSCQPGVKAGRLHVEVWQNMCAQNNAGRVLS